MSTANDVPETWSLSGDDAWETLKRTGRRRLATDAFRRFRAADGTSHARSLAFLVTLLLVQGVIALVALASMVHPGGWSDLLTNTVRTVAPRSRWEGAHRRRRASTSSRDLPQLHDPD